MKTRFGIAFCVAALVPGLAAAKGGNPGALGHCEWTQGVAASQSDVLIGPELFASFGEVAAASSDQTALGTPTPRLEIGIRYSLSRLLRGLSMRDRAEADCRRWAAAHALHQALRLGPDLGRAAALAARAKVLEAAVPKGRALVKKLRAEVASGKRSIAELNAMEVRQTQLEASVHQTELERLKLKSEPSPPSRPLTALITRYRRADAEVEALSARARETTAWDVRVEGGYERLFDVNQDLPLFGQVTLSYNLGGLWQRSADARAAKGEQRSLLENIRGVARKSTALLASLRATLAVERARSIQTEALLADLRDQRRALEGLDTRAVQRFGELLFFETVNAEADQAYLARHVATLSKMLSAEIAP